VTPAPSEKRKVARGALLCSQGRGLDGVRNRSAIRLSSIMVSLANDQLTPSRAGRGTGLLERFNGTGLWKDFLNVH
jgi:hypothetical protein